VKSSIKKSRKNFRAELSQLLGFLFVRISVYTILLVLLFFFYDVSSHGLKVISREFLSQPPRHGMTEGGILPAIVGTFLATVITALFAVPIGIAAAIYLHEYARPNRFTRLISYL
jgi:ABC-type phosphate transport system, permease component